MIPWAVFVGIINPEPLCIFHLTLVINNSIKVQGDCNVVKTCSGVPIVHEKMREIVVLSI